MTSFLSNESIKTPSRTFYQNNTYLEPQSSDRKRHLTGPVPNNMSFSSLKEITAGENSSQTNSHLGKGNILDYSSLEKNIETRHNNFQGEHVTSNSSSHRYPNFGYVVQTIKEENPSQESFRGSNTNFPGLFDNITSPSKMNPQDPIKVYIEEKDRDINNLNYNGIDSYHPSENVVEQANNYLWRLSKEKERFHKKQNESLNEVSNLISPEKQKSSLQNANRLRSSPTSNIKNILSNSRGSHANAELDFNVLIEKQRKFYEMLNQNEQEGRNGSSSPKHIKNKNKGLSGQSSSTSKYSQIVKPKPRISEEDIDFRVSTTERTSTNSRFENNAVELDIYKLLKTVNNQEKILAEKNEEIEALKALSIDLHDEIEKLRRLRETDSCIKIDETSKFKQEKKNLQNKLDKALDRVINSTNTSVKQNVSHVLGTSALSANTINFLQAEISVLQSKLERAEKEHEFQKRSNESLKKRINSLLLNDTRDDVKSTLSHQEMTSLLKEYVIEIEELSSIKQRLEASLKQAKEENEDREIFWRKEVDELNRKAKRVEKESKSLQQEKAKLADLTENAQNKYVDRIKLLEKQVIELEHQNTKIKDENERNKKALKKLSEIKPQNNTESNGPDVHIQVQEMYQEQIDDLTKQLEELRESLLIIQKEKSDLIEELNHEKLLREKAESAPVNNIDPAELEALQIQLNKTLEELKELPVVKRELKQKIEIIDSLEESHKDLKQQYDKTEGFYRNLENKYNQQQLEKEAFLNDQAKSNTNEKNQLLEERNQLIEEKNKLIERIEQLQKEISEINLEKEAYATSLKQLDSIKKNLAQSQQDLKDSEFEKKRLNNDMDSLQEKFSKVITDYEAKLMDANNEIQSLSDQTKLLASSKNTNNAVKELKVQNEKLREEIAQLRRTLNQRTSDAENDLEMQKLQNDHLKIVLEEQDEKIKRLEEQLKKASASKPPKEKQVNESQEKDKLIEKLTKEIQELKNQLESKGKGSNISNEEQTQEILAEFEEQRQIVEKQKVVIMRQKGELEDLQLVLDETKKIIQDLEKENEKNKSKAQEHEETLAVYGKQMETLLEKISDLSVKEQEYLQQIRALKKK